MSWHSNLIPTQMLTALALIVMSLGSVQPAQAAAAQKISSLDKAAADGKNLFEHDKFGGARTCSACHINGGTTPGRLPGGGKIPSLKDAAAQYPRFNPKLGRVITLEDQLIRCIKGGVGGTPPADDSPQMADLIAYLTYLSKGAIMGQQFK